MNITNLIHKNVTSSSRIPNNLTNEIENETRNKVSSSMLSVYYRVTKLNDPVRNAVRQGVIK